VIETMQTAAPDGAATGARRSGQAGPALLFVHGVGSTAAIWDAQLEEFGRDHRALAIELRGNGALADPDPASISREAFASDVLAVAAAAGIDRFTIVGCSLGGVVAFELWKRVPERIEAMAIVGSFARYPDAQKNADGIKAAAREAGDMEIFARARAAKLGLTPERTRETVEQMACKSIPCYLASTQATWTGDYRDVLPGITVPVLVAHGERDAVAPRALSEEIAAGIPGARLVEIENAGHVANADAPERFNEILRAFLRELQPR
jgi:pimeloyl-ACP methyl ester carboxylesterase